MSRASGDACVQSSPFLLTPKLMKSVLSSGSRPNGRVPTHASDAARHESHVIAGPHGDGRDAHGQSAPRRRHGRFTRNGARIPRFVLARFISTELSYTHARSLQQKLTS